MPTVNMWCAQTPKPRTADTNAGEYDGRIAEERLAREGRQNLRDDPEGGQDQDIHLRMSKHPEEMLPEQRAPAGFRDEEVGREEAVDHQQRDADGERREGEDDQQRQ